MLLKKRNLMALTAFYCSFMMASPASYAQEMKPEIGQETAQKTAQKTEAAAFYLGITNNSNHVLTYRLVKAGIGSTCDAFVHKKILHPGDGFVAVQRMLDAQMLTCTYSFTTEKGALVTLAITDPTYVYLRAPSYAFFDDKGNSLSTLYTPEAYPILRKNLMHKSASVTINPF